MRILLIISLLFLTTPLFADEYYAWEDQNGNINVTQYVSGSKDSIQDVLNELGAKGKVEQVTAQDLPLLKENVSHLKFQGKRLVVDQVKKDADTAEKQAKQAEKQAVLTKLGITEEELKKLNV